MEWVEREARLTMDMMEVLIAGKNKQNFEGHVVVLMY